MAITLNCPCGKTLRVADEHAGKRVRCPSCQQIQMVPKPEAEPIFEVVEEPPPAPEPPRPRARPVSVDEDGEETGTYGLSGASSDEDDEPDDVPREKPMPDFRKGSGRREADRRARKKRD